MASRKEQKEQLRAKRQTEDSAQAATERRRKMVQYGTGAVLLAACVVAILIVVSQSGSDGGGDTTVEGVSTIESQLKGIPQDGTVLGEPDADVTVVEFGDLQCPVCKAFSEQVSTELISGVVASGDAGYEFRQWPIIGEESVTAAKAALAAGEQGRYWNFVQLFYENQGTENTGYVTDDFLQSIAEGAGVRDIDQWNDDREDPKWDTVLADNDTAAQEEGFTGTPSVVVEGPNGSEVPEPLDLNGIEAAIKSVG